MEGKRCSNLPPGFRFHPTDEELIIHYLKNQAMSRACPVSIIPEVDIYKFDPWHLPDMAEFGENEWYFFTPRDRKYPNGIRPNRATLSGYWKATGTDKAIYSGGKYVGIKKALVFYKGRPPKGCKTDWIMHEYRLTEAKHQPVKQHGSMRGGPYWPVATGRRDGKVSSAKEALNNIPPPTSNLSSLLTFFGRQGLDLKDLVVLSGAHTIGISHCPSFTERLYNFTGRGFGEDPKLDSEYAANLKARKCPNPKDNTTIVEMDPGSFRTFDLDYYKLVLKRRGLFQSDAALTTGVTAKSIILELVSSPLDVFFGEFGKAMVKMTQIGVHTGSSGEIRKHCAFVN